MAVGEDQRHIMARVGEKESRAHKLSPTVSGGGGAGPGWCLFFSSGRRKSCLVCSTPLSGSVCTTCVCQAVQGSGETQASLAPLILAHLLLSVQQTF